MAWKCPGVGELCRAVGNTVAELGLQAPLGELKAPTSATSQSLNYSMTDSAPGPLSLEEMERKHIGEILERTKGVIGGKGGAAEVLGLPISTLRNRMKKLGMK